MPSLHGNVRPGRSKKLRFRVTLSSLEQQKSDSVLRPFETAGHAVLKALVALKTVDLEVRPIFHWAAPRVKAHVFLCMLAYHVEHFMRAKLAPLLYDDTDREEAARLRNSVVAKAQRSPAAIRKETTGRTADNLPVQSFRGLLGDLATYCRIKATTPINEKCVFNLYSKPTATQARAFELLGIKPECTQ